MKKFILSLLVIITCTSSYFGQTTVDLNAPLKLDPVVRTGKLANGMTYYIRKNAKPEKRAELRLAVNAGATYENDDQQGLAHFCEHMCFNGTKNFKKSALVDYLESVGTKFGPHLNAYTSFDETVYMLQLPTDTEKILLKGLQILEDWAHNVSFDKEEIDKERGVVTEEWRLGQGADERMRNKVWPIMFKGSRYADRLPIGKPEILKNCSYETLKQFYKDWYRTDLMAVIAVGDFDLDKMEKIIKEKFSAIPTTPNPRPTQTFNVPDNKELAIARATDKEAQYTAIQMVYKHPLEKVKTQGDFRRDLVISLYNQMLNARLAELVQTSNPPYNYAYAYYGNMVRSKNNYTSVAVCGEKDAENAFRALVEENERAKRFGFTTTEIAREKKNYLRRLEQQYNERDKTESGQLVWRYVYHFLTEEPATGIEFEYDMSKKLIDGITMEELNALPKAFITNNGENCTIVLNGPEKEGVSLPSDETIKNIFNEVSKKELKPYDDKSLNVPLIAKEPAAGKVVGEKQLKEVGITEWTLSNGVKVALKPTDFKNDQIIFNAFSFGGTSNTPEKDDVSASYAAQVVDESGIGEYDQIALKKYLSGKVVGVSPYVNELEEGFNGSASPQDIETAFQLIYQYFNAPRKDPIAFASFMKQLESNIENQSASPEANYYDTIAWTMSGHHFRHRPSTLENLNELDMEKAFNYYKERFADASDFTFTFVGSFDVAKMKPLVEKYLGSLPSIKRKENWKDIGLKRPKGVIEKTVKKGSEPKANVTYAFTGDFQFDAVSRFQMRALISLVSIRLREILREEKGGTYGVRVSPQMSKYPKSAYYININFGCGPEKLDELCKATLAEIENIKNVGCEEKNLVKIKETMRREYEVGMKENRFWLSAITSNYKNGEDISKVSDALKFLDQLKSEDFKVWAKQYFNMNNYAKFVLIPETTK